MQPCRESAHTGGLLKSSDVEKFFFCLDQPPNSFNLNFSHNNNNNNNIIVSPYDNSHSAKDAAKYSSRPTSSPNYRSPLTSSPRRCSDESASVSSPSQSSTEENIPPVSTLLPPLRGALPSTPYSLAATTSYYDSFALGHGPCFTAPTGSGGGGGLLLQESQQDNYAPHHGYGAPICSGSLPYGERKMYQNGLALPASAPAPYAPHGGGGGGDSGAGAYLSPGAPSPVYVPSARAMLPVQYMTSSGGQGVASNAASGLWGSPSSSDNPYASHQSLHHPGVSSAFPFAPPHPSAGGTPGGGGGQQLPSPTSGRADPGAMVGFGSLSRANGLSPYSPYMTGGELSPWNSFNNMAMQQGFRQTGPEYG